MIGSRYYWSKLRLTKKNPHRLLTHGAFGILYPYPVQILFPTIQVSRKFATASSELFGINEKTPCFQIFAEIAE
jgi:hypothetical protein